MQCDYNYIVSQTGDSHHGQQGHGNQHNVHGGQQHGGQHGGHGSHY